MYEPFLPPFRAGLVSLRQRLAPPRRERVNWLAEGGRKVLLNLLLQKVQEHTVLNSAQLSTCLAGQRPGVTT